LVWPIICGLFAGCSSAKPPPPVPPVVQQASHFADNAAKQSAQQNWAGAVKAWQQALEQFRLVDDRTHEAVALHNLAQAQRELNQLDSAHELLEQAAALNLGLGRTNDWWRNQIALLQIETLIGKGEQPDRRLEELAPQVASVNEQRVRGLYLIELGRAQQRAGKSTEALQQFNSAEALFQKTRDQSGLAAVAANRAQFFAAQNDFSNALSEWDRALAQYQKLADVGGLARSLAGKGTTLLEAKQDLAAAEDLLRRASGNFQALKMTKERIAALRGLEQVLRAQNKVREAEQVQRELAQAQTADSAAK
jgi:tetratricopeptide (TPR) repeat protein